MKIIARASGVISASTLCLSVLVGAASAGCSSEKAPTPPLQDSGTADTGASPADSGAPGADAGKPDAGGDFGSYGAPCTNPINVGAGGGGGDGGAGGANADGGSDPACVGVYDLCANVGSVDKCTKKCAYPGGSGAQETPDCPSPPTNGKCTPRGFCQ